ncbi:TfoX/Sxy family protein [Cellulosimicrobium marinum]|uniref:TfoX/Sxy family protein n=1 Tax=Cellulosimicrobium marinum TaxID=1638992 RepID=UPI001E3CE0AD|nr:TfoX/Sxy family protein [Cellulosimicrobium marinum]MCB7135540.1 TfoX/Sxy family protein [Cellulosimicrobium marinum]
MSARSTDARTRALLDRVRDRLPTGASVREVSMFGAVAVMVDDSMVVAVHKDHSLLVRVTPDDDADLGRREEASRAEMGAGRSMGTGWLRVDAAAVEADAVLDLWVGAALRRLRDGSPSEGTS